MDRTTPYADSMLGIVVSSIDRNKITGPIEGLDTRKDVSIETAPEAIRWLAEDISAVLYQTVYRDFSMRGEVITQELFAEYFIKSFEFAAAVRVVTVDENRRVRLQGIKPADFEYPAIFGPILASIGRYNNVEKGYRLNPVLGKKLVTMLQAESALTLKVASANEKVSESIKEVEGTLTLPKWYMDFMALCRQVKIFTNISLPRETEVNDEEFYRIFNDGDYIVGVDGNPRNESILNALFIQCVKLSELMGEYRVKYVLVQSMRPVFTALAMKVFHRLQD